MKRFRKFKVKREKCAHFPFLLCSSASAKACFSEVLDKTLYFLKRLLFAIQIPLCNFFYKFSKKVVIGKLGLVISSVEPIWVGCKCLVLKLIIIS